MECSFFTNLKIVDQIGTQIQDAYNETFVLKYLNDLFFTEVLYRKSHCSSVYMKCQSSSEYFTIIIQYSK
jgi:hypothetical protein